MVARGGADEAHGEMEARIFRGIFKKKNRAFNIKSIYWVELKCYIFLGQTVY
jgi:hypothetical protein